MRLETQMTIEFVGLLVSALVTGVFLNSGYTGFWFFISVGVLLVNTVFSAITGTEVGQMENRQ